MKKIVVIGASGQLGTDVCKVLGDVKDYEVITISHDQLLIEDPVEVDGMLETFSPDVVINTAAFHDVTRCEKDWETSFYVNAIGARNLGEASSKLGFHLIHISTDYVFDGTSSFPYKETDPARPLNVYGNSKLSGENFILSSTNRASILRTCGLYGNGKGHTNFVNKVLDKIQTDDSMQVIDDEFITPTPTIEVARCIKALLENPVYGIIHATSEGVCSWFEFAEAIMDIIQNSVKVKYNFSLYKALPGQFDNGVKRPKFSVLGNFVLRNKKIYEFPYWRKSLEEYLKDYVL